MRFIPRIVPTLLVIVLLLVAAPSMVRAACSGDCGPDLATAPKTVEKYVKTRWKAVAGCGKKANPACPTACPQPNGALEPYLLSSSCAGLIACNLDALAESAYGTTWNDTGVCASTPATACGTVRGASAGKLVSAKLTRRRTSKMNTFAKDVAKCAATIAKVSSCDAAICNDAADWIDEIFPLAISPTGYQSLPFSVVTPGEGVASLTIAAVGTDWAIGGSESVVVTYDLDGGTPLGQLVLYGGAAPTTYRVMLDALEAGEHTLGLHPEKMLSPASKAPVSVTAAVSVEAIPVGDPRYDFTRFAPILLGIDQDLNIVQTPSGADHLGNARSDTPLIVYATPIPGAGLTTYRYVFIWSNEDGGTGNWPDLLMARYGRTSDIEGMVEVDVSDAGVRLGVRFRPDESGSLTTFAGSFRGTHPIVRTFTANGLIQDDGASTLAFGLPPFAYDDAGLPRELGMDLDPISYAIMAKEMIREKKIETAGNAATTKLSDLRNYLYLDYDIDVDIDGRVLRGIAIVGGVTYYSDHNLGFNLTLNPRVSDGVARLAIELPPGTQISDIQQYGLQGIGTMAGTLASASAFILDAGYLPGTPLTFTGPQAQSGTNPFWLVTP
jgi:hypothetical protein